MSGDHGRQSDGAPPPAPGERQFALQDACSSRPPPASEAQGVGAAGRGAASDPREGPQQGALRRQKPLTLRPW